MSSTQRGVPSAYCLFETEIGTCGIAWRIPPASPILTGFQLPEEDDELTEARIALFCGHVGAAEPPQEVVQVIERVQSHLQGELQEFADIPVDLSGVSPFAKRVYGFIRQVEAGHLTTYGIIASALDNPEASQAVGQVLGRNPIPLIIPCHRVVGAGKLGGFSAAGGQFTKVKLLKIEKAIVEVGPPRPLKAKPQPQSNLSFDFD